MFHGVLIWQVVISGPEACRLLGASVRENNLCFYLILLGKRELNGTNPAQELAVEHTLKEVVELLAQGQLDCGSE